MNRELIDKLAKNPKFISGVHNYCDRWCERCSLTSRCMNFALGEETFADPETRDIKNQVFWDKLSEIFKVTMEMVKETAEELGIDLNTLDTEEAVKQEKCNRETAKNHECARAGKAYGKMVDNWFKSVEGLFEQKEEELNLKLQLELPNANPVEEAATLSDTVEIIRWYQHQIHVKLMRAIHGSLDERDEILDDFPKDSDGSAKVALIGMDRSITAWGILNKYFPQRENEILNLLVHLDRLRRQTKKVFPDANSFVRPGFDD